MRISEGAKKLGVAVINAVVIGGAFRVKDIFTTQDGSWDVSDKPYSIPQWARDTYLKPTNDPMYFDDAGGDHHIFCRVEDRGGNPIVKDIVTGTKDDKNLVFASTGQKKSRWLNRPMFNASFSPERGEKGYWCAEVFSSDKSVVPEGVTNIGLPNNLHVSTFIVWQDSEGSTGNNDTGGLTITVRELKEINHALYYGANLNHGTTGHNQLILLYKFALTYGFWLSGSEVIVPSGVKVVDDDRK